MNINFKQSQFELFPTTGTSTPKDHNPHRIFSSLTLSLENIILLSIFVVMGIICAFSLGVEKGKKATLKEVESDTAGIAIAATENKAVADAELYEKIDPKKTEENREESLPEIKSASLFPVALNKRRNYTIQVASFRKEEYAQKEVSMLKQKRAYKGFEIFVLPKGNWSIVCIGSFGKKSEANVLLGQLKKRYNDCLIRRL